MIKMSSFNVSKQIGMNEIVESWIFEYTRSWVWLLFKGGSSDAIIEDEFIKGVLLKGQRGTSNNDVFLSQWMFLVKCGRELLQAKGNDITALEEAIKMMPQLKDRFKSLSAKKLSKLERLLMEQAVGICISEGAFDLAKRVKARLWTGKLTQDMEELSVHLDQVIDDCSESDRLSSYDELIVASVDLLEELCENLLPRSYLVKKAEEESKNKTTKIKRVFQPTGIKLTGPLLSAFLDLHGLVPEEGVGFMPPEKFQNAIKDLQSRKSQLLKNIPECLSVQAADSTEEPETVRRKSYLRRGGIQRTPQAGKMDESSSDSSSETDLPKRSPSSSRCDLNIRKRLGVSDDLFSDDFRPAISPPDHKKAARSRRTKWSQEEEAVLCKYVKKYGPGHWIDIVDLNVLPGRTNIDLKDKWRVLTKKSK